MEKEGAPESYLMEKKRSHQERNKGGTLGMSKPPRELSSSTLGVPARKKQKIKKGKKSHPEAREGKREILSACFMHNSFKEDALEDVTRKRRWGDLKEDLGRSCSVCVREKNSSCQVREGKTIQKGEKKIVGRRGREEKRRRAWVQKSPPLPSKDRASYAATKKA